MDFPNQYLQFVIDNYAKHRDRYVLTDLQVEYREAVVLGIGSERSIENFRYAKG